MGECKQPPAKKPIQLTCDAPGKPLELRAKATMKGSEVNGGGNRRKEEINTKPLMRKQQIWTEGIKQRDTQDALLCTFADSIKLISHLLLARHIHLILSPSQNRDQSRETCSSRRWKEPSPAATRTRTCLGYRAFVWLLPPRLGIFGPPRYHPVRSSHHLYPIAQDYDLDRLPAGLEILVAAR